MPNADYSLPKKRAYFVYFDSTDIHLCPDVGRHYVPVGSQKKTDSPGLNNPWKALFGSLIYPSGEGIYTIHEHKRHQEVRAHLERLISLDPDGFFIVVMDNASAHQTPQLNPFWEQQKERLYPLFLPTYSPHLNLIERLWRFMRGQVTKDQYYQTLSRLCEAIVEWFGKVSFQEFCSLMGINEN